jgi:hypothetical protein
VLRAHVAAHASIARRAHGGQGGRGRGGITRPCAGARARARLLRSPSHGRNDRTAP